MADAPEPGWYPDPEGSPGERWWTGVQWGTEIRSGPDVDVPAPSPKRRWVLVGGGVALLLVFGGAVAAGTMLTGADETVEVAAEPEPEPEPEPTPEPDVEAPESPSEPVVVFDADLWETVDDYVAYLSNGRWEDAHRLLSQDLRARDGWGYADFVEFWDGYLVSANLVQVDADAQSMTAVAEVDYFLSDQSVSREEIRLEFIERDGWPYIDDYEVLSSERS